MFFDCWAVQGIQVFRLMAAVVRPNRALPPTLHQHVHILVAQACKCVTLDGKKNFTDVIKDLEMGLP